MKNIFKIIVVVLLFLTITIKGKAQTIETYTDFVNIMTTAGCAEVSQPSGWTADPLMTGYEYVHFWHNTDGTLITVYVWADNTFPGAEVDNGCTQKLKQPSGDSTKASCGDDGKTCKTDLATLTFTTCP